MKTMRGFTLIEVMIVLAIMGVLAAWAVPSFDQMTANNRLVTNANNLVYTFNLARSEAIARARPIDITAKAGGWINGWQVKDGATTIKDWEALTGNPDITSGATTYQYDAQGRLSASGTLTLCDNRTGESGRQLTMTKIGRASISTVPCE